MSQVLEKAVLLDETGQEIVNKLTEIKEAIGNSGEYIPLAIRVTTPPTKTSYVAGDALDLSGIVVSLVGSNGSLIDVTAACAFSPVDGAILSTSDSSISITYHYDKDNVDFTTSQAISVIALEAVSISVTTPPIKTSYLVGDSLDLTGIVVTATFNNGTTSDVTLGCTFSPADGSTLSSNTITAVNITYLTLTTSQAIEVLNPIYGVEWDGTASSAWARTDAASDFVDPVPQLSDGNGGWTQGSSPFDNISPWKDMAESTVGNVGTVVSIPKFYYKWTLEASKIKLQISPNPIDGFLVSPAHQDRGDGEGERDVIYVGKYHSNSSYQSASGYTPQYTYYSTFHNNTHNNALNHGIEDVYLWDYATYWTVCMLYLVEFADWNSQSKIGKGYNVDNSATATGLTDSMTYHTGTTAASRSDTGHVLYRHIEDLWSNIIDWVDGISVYNGNVKGWLLFAGESSAPKIGTIPMDMLNCLKSYSQSSVSGFEFALIPASAVSDSTFSSYICDMVMTQNMSGSSQHLIIGGGHEYNDPYRYGLFYFNIQNQGTQGSAGGRLMILPNNS